MHESYVVLNKQNDVLKNANIKCILKYYKT